VRINLAVSAVLVVGLLTIVSPMYAHHGSTAYDNSKPVVLKNVTVTQVNWGNPHMLLLFDAKDEFRGPQNLAKHTRTAHRSSFR
jgi:Family of unknown function (DUF6152)